MKSLLLKYVGDNKLLESKISLFGKPEEVKSSEQDLEKDEEIKKEDNDEYQQKEEDMFFKLDGFDQLNYFTNYFNHNNFNRVLSKINKKYL